MLHIDGAQAWFVSKNGNRMKRFASLAAMLARELRVESAILDGEIIVMDEHGPDFHALMFGWGVPAYAAFDLLWHDGRDLRAQPLWRRKKALRTLAGATGVGYVDHVADPALFAVAVQRDLEGIVAKRRGDPYTPSTEWIKVKHAGYSQMEGRWELFAR